MFGSIALAVIILSVIGMSTVIWLYDKYERPHLIEQAPKRQARNIPPIPDDVLVRSAKLLAKEGDPRLN
jgi:hypothetical protein